MAYTSVDAFKDFCGAIGAIFVSVPWLKDFQLRKRRAAIKDIDALGKLAVLKTEIEERLKEKIESPKMADFVWTIVGLLLIFLSFVVGFAHGMKEIIDASTSTAPRP